MKKLSIILMMLFLALSQNANAKCKSNKIDPFADFSDPECTKEEIDKKYNAGTYYKEMMEKQQLARIQEKKERYNTALEKMKRDNPNFKKPPKKAINTSTSEKITRDDLIEYRQKKGNY